MKYNPLFQHRKSTRLKDYDYSKAGEYFITICTHEKECFFGDIVDGEMILNAAGEVANYYWLQIPQHFPNAVLHKHVVMPNHVHGIIEIMAGDNTGGGMQIAGIQKVAMDQNLVGVQNFEPLLNFDPLNFEPQNSGRDQQNNPESPRNEFQKIIPRSIGSMIRGYKIGVTKWFRYSIIENNDTDFAAGILKGGIQNFEPLLFESLDLEPYRQNQRSRIWQRNFHDHIIRNEKEYQKISRYIGNNPKSWREDRFFK